MGKGTKIASSLPPLTHFCSGNKTYLCRTPIIISRDAPDSGHIKPNKSNVYVSTGWAEKKFRTLGLCCS